MRPIYLAVAVIMLVTALLPLGQANPVLVLQTAVSDSGSFAKVTPADMPEEDRAFPAAAAMLLLLPLALGFSRRSQIKMGETIAILIVFFLLLVFAFSFFGNVSQTTYEEKRDEFQSLRSIEIAQIVSFLPELQCTFDNVPVANCFDILKVNATFQRLNTSEEYRLYYYDFFRTSTIYLRQIYPPSSWQYVFYNNTGNWTKRLNTKIPVSLYNATADVFYMGVLEVDVFS